MKPRYIFTGLALLAIGLLIVWIARNTYWGEVEVPMPAKGEARTNSLYAAERLVAQLGATAHPQRNLGELPDPQAVIYLSYWNWDLIPSRRERLEAWVAKGGRLVADRSLIGGDRALEQWSGIVRTELDLEKYDLPEGEDHCVNLQVAGEGRADYKVCGVDQASRLTASRDASWVLSDNHGIQALRIPIGLGSITLLNAHPFDNAQLFNGDDGLLFVTATGLERAAIRSFSFRKRRRRRCWR